MKEITMGQYYAADSLIHQLDPRTKIFSLLLYMILLFSIRELLWYLVILLTLIYLYVLAKIPICFFIKGIKPIILLLIFTFVMRIFITPGTVLMKLWIFKVTEEGLRKSIQLTSRIFLMISGTSLLSYTSTPKMLADGLERSFLFLEKFKIPVRSMSVMVMIAFRFIPVLLEETNILVEAQKSRGADFENGSILKKSKNIVRLTFPLFISLIRRSLDLSMAMEARGYRENHERTQMNPLIYQKKDKITYGLVLGYSGSILILMYVLPILFK